MRAETRVVAFTYKWLDNDVDDVMLGRSGSLSVERNMWKNGEKWFSLSVDRPFHIGFVAAQHWTDLAHQKLPQDLKSGQNYVFFYENLLFMVSNDPDRIY